jgi:hypothetical protein
MATAKGIGTPWTVFQSIPSHASEPYNSRKMIHMNRFSWEADIELLFLVSFKLFPELTNFLKIISAVLAE